jgi:hypothetical protein
MTRAAGFSELGQAQASPDEERADNGALKSTYWMDEEPARRGM